MKNPAIAQRGYARNEREELILIESGLKPEQIYLEGRGHETLSRIGMRSGELLATVGGLRVLGDSRREIVAAVQRIHKVGAAVIDVESRRRSDRHGVEMLDRALARLLGEIYMPDGKAKAMQTRSVRSRVGSRMGMREAIKQMAGWSARTAYLRLGKRGLPSGRLGKKD